MDRWGCVEGAAGVGCDSAPLPLAPFASLGSRCFFPGAALIFWKDRSPDLPPPSRDTSCQRRRAGWTGTWVGAKVRHEGRPGGQGLPVAEPRPAEKGSPGGAPLTPCHLHQASSGTTHLTALLTPTPVPRWLPPRRPCRHSSTPGSLVEKEALLLPPFFLPRLRPQTHPRGNSSSPHPPPSRSKAGITSLALGPLPLPHPPSPVPAVTAQGPVTSGSPNPLDAFQPCLSWPFSIPGH